MIITVSISQFRKHISDYLAKAKDGYTVILKDDKKDQQIVELVQKKKFNPETFGKALKAAAGIFTTEHYPEWQTKKDIIKWVKQGRNATDRNF